MGEQADKHLPPPHRATICLNDVWMSRVTGEGSSKARRKRVSGDLATICLPSRLISWFELRLPLLPLQLYPFNALLRLILEHLL